MADHNTKPQHITDEEVISIEALRISLMCGVSFAVRSQADSQSQTVQRHTPDDPVALSDTETE